MIQHSIDLNLNYNNEDVMTNKQKFVSTTMFGLFPTLVSTHLNMLLTVKNELQVMSAHFR